MFGPKMDFNKLIKDGAVIVDVRSKGEYQAGHIQGSRNIPLDKLRAELPALKKLNKPVVTVCASGNRSEAAKTILGEVGIEAYNGGGWSDLQRQIQ